MLDLLSAGSADRYSKVLLFVATGILALDHEASAANVAAFAPHKGSTPAERTGRSEDPPATRTSGIAALDLFVAIGAMITKGRAAATLETKTTIPFNELATMDTGLFISCHSQRTSSKT
jgi:hypothetical protein